MDSHNHSHATHSAKCDEEGCTYISMTHAHDDKSAAMALSEDLSYHNKSEHQKESDPQEILAAVKAKMQLAS